MSLKTTETIKTYIDNVNAIDVANYVIDRTNTNNNKQKFPLYKLRLHKIVYYLAVAYLDKFDEMLFEIEHENIDRIEKGLYGACIHSLYSTTKRYNTSHIFTSRKIEYSYLQFNENDNEFKLYWTDSTNFSKDIFNKETQQLFNTIIDKISLISTHDMIEYHRNEEAWLKHEEDITCKGIRSYLYTQEELREAMLTLNNMIDVY